MKKILLLTSLFASITSWAQDKPANTQPQAGDLIIEAFEGEISYGSLDTNPEEPINYAALQVKPQFPGGEDALKKYIIDNVQKKNLKEGVTGKDLKVILSFIIEKDGTTSFPKLLMEPGFGTGKEMLRVLSELKTKWSPGMQNSKPVRANYILTILYTVPK